MANCERLKTCPFFSGHMAGMPSVADLMRSTYCLGDKTKCARYMVSSAGYAVPPDLYPNDSVRALQLMRSGVHH
jgi:hypothetical protein